MILSFIQIDWLSSAAKHSLPSDVSWFDRKDRFFVPTYEPERATRSRGQRLAFPATAEGGAKRP
jgi:hypothetical protein